MRKILFLIFFTFNTFFFIFSKDFIKDFKIKYEFEFGVITSTINEYWILVDNTGLTNYGYFLRSFEIPSIFYFFPSGKEDKKNEEKIIDNTKFKGSLSLKKIKEIITYYYSYKTLIPFGYIFNTISITGVNSGIILSILMSNKIINNSIDGGMGAIVTTLSVGGVLTLLGFFFTFFGYICQKDHKYYKKDYFDYINYFVSLKDFKIKFDLVLVNK